MRSLTVLVVTSISILLKIANLPHVTTTKKKVISIHLSNLDLNKLDRYRKRKKMHTIQLFCNNDFWLVLSLVSKIRCELIHKIFNPFLYRVVDELKELSILNFLPTLNMWLSCVMSWLTHPLMLNLNSVNVKKFINDLVKSNFKSYLMSNIQ